MTQHTTEKKAIHFGAGNIGRGFIGPILVRSGYHVVFSDVVKDVINDINNRGSYDVYILDEDEHQEPISDVSAVLSTSEDIIREFADSAVDLVTTAVGPQILEKVAVTIAQGLAVRRKANAGPLNIIACENLVNQTTLLRDHVFKNLQSDEDKSWVDESVGFANCSVDRIVPPFDPAATGTDNSLDVGVEGFYEWVVDKQALQPTRADVHLQGIRLTTKLEGYIERKLFTLNCGHAIVAYLGYLKGYSTIDEAVRDEAIRNVVHGALLDEGGAALVRKHGFEKAAHHEYVEKIMSRFANPKLKDEIVRVGRQPLRKLAKGDRLLGPAYMAREYELSIPNLTKGIAAALLYDVEDDEQSVELQKKVKDTGLAKVVAELTGWAVGSDEHRGVVETYELLRNKGLKT